MGIHPTQYLMRIFALAIGLLLAGVSQGAIEIDHDPVEKAKSGRRIALDAQVEGADIYEVRSYFRADNDGRWHFVPMLERGSTFKGLLPAADVHTDFVRYQLLVISQARELMKSDIFTIEIEEDEEAAARLNSEPPRDVKIDVSDLQDAQDLYDSLSSSDRVSAADRSNPAQTSGEANPQSRVDVRSEYNPRSDKIEGFDDYINLSYVADAVAYGVTSGIVSAAQAAAAEAPAAQTASKAAVASTGGSSTGLLLGGLAVAGVGAAAAGGGGGGGGGAAAPAPTPDPDPDPDPMITNFAGRSEGPNECAATGDFAFRWVVDLTQTDDQVTGFITFHKCPDEGRARYDVTGTATDASTIQLDGVLDFSQGPLAATAPANQVFTVSVGQAPDPNFAE